MENQIYMVYFQRESVEFIENTFNPKEYLKLNLYVGYTLQMPHDFFDLPFETIIARYLQHYVWWKFQKGFRPKSDKSFVKPLF